LNFRVDFLVSSFDFREGFMASTILTPAKPDTSDGYGGGYGPGGNRFGGGGGDSGLPEYRVPGHTYKLGMWFALAGIVMLFAGFTSAMVVRRGMSFDWVSIVVPRLLWVNTGVLLASSLTLEFSRRALTENAVVNFIRWLAVTVALGVTFLAGQLVVWRELAARGVYLATNPSSSFFYVLTAAHGVHLLGGVLALGYVVLHAARMARGRERRTALDVTAIYWHFMGVLWVYIFFLLTKWA
jgi:cytochrome c oxidase subunit 3